MKVKVSFHGHSKFSDGVDSVKKLVEEAYKLKIDYFGISDHNTTEHFTSLYQEIAQVNNQNGFFIIPISAVEVNLFNGKYQNDILFAKVGERDEDFIKWCEVCIKNRKQTKNINQIIESAVKIFNALIVIPHPQMPHVASAKFELLKDLAEKLDSKVKKNIGVEVRNWSSNIFPKNSQREEELTKLVTELGLAQFGLADFHSASDIKYMYTLAEVKQKDTKSLITAVQKRQVEPVRLQPATDLERLGIAYSLGRASIRMKFVPKEIKQKIS